MPMRPPSLWWREPGAGAAMLAPAAKIYGAVAAWRMARPGADVGVPVICVGGLTLGGAGKTPTALAVAEILVQAGERPFLLTRGYGGSLAGPVTVDPSRHAASDVGDEPLLLARIAPTIVARDRVAGAQAARAAGASAIVMDDGFHNPALVKHLSLIVVDGRRGIGNARVFPAGPLRAPLDAQLRRAQGLVVVGDGPGAAHAAGFARDHERALFHARLEPDAKAVAALGARAVLAFAGIADPEKFFATLAQSRIDVSSKHAFADHHRYTEGEAAALVAAAERDGLVLLTTEKDLARLAGDADAAALRAKAQGLPVRLVVEEAAQFRQFVLAPIRGDAKDRRI